jgi:hypothetical protein
VLVVHLSLIYLHATPLPCYAKGPCLAADTVNTLSPLTPTPPAPRRRVELEKWLWALIGRPELARSHALRQFLDFDKAMARAQQHRWGGGRGACVGVWGC